MCCVLCVRVCVGLELVCGCECVRVWERENVCMDSLGYVLVNLYWR